MKCKMLDEQVFICEKATEKGKESQSVNLIRKEWILCFWLGVKH